jgi:hypothetical protein
MEAFARQVAQNVSAGMCKNVTDLEEVSSVSEAQNGYDYGGRDGAQTPKLA